MYNMCKDAKPEAKGWGRRGNRRFPYFSLSYYTIPITAIAPCLKNKILCIMYSHLV